MAVGTIAATLNPAAPRPRASAGVWRQYVIITITGNYGAGGVTLNLAGLDTPGLSKPFDWKIRSGASTPTGQSYDYKPGTNRTDGTVMSFAGSTEDTDDTSWPDTTLVAEFQYRAAGI